MLRGTVIALINLEKECVTVTQQMRLFAILGVLAGFLLVQACGRKLPEERGCNFVQNQNMQRVSWGENLPVDLYLDNSVPGEYDEAVKAAVAIWNDRAKKIGYREFFRLRSGSPGAIIPTQDNYTKIYLLNTWEDNRKFEQARTTVYWSGSQIYEADIRVNNKDFQFFINEPPPEDGDRGVSTGEDTADPTTEKVHLPSLLVHELGHVLGLAHNTHGESVMQTNLANGVIRTELSKADIESLECEY
jgi:hypothetical protein